MELIEIISDIIIYGGLLLVVVVGFSFFLSKTKTETESLAPHKSMPDKSRQISTLQKINYEQSLSRKNQAGAYPQIFSLENFKPKEIKIIRKSTVAKRESQESMRFDSKSLTRTDGSGIRYTIVNEEQKKKSLKASNFYF